MTTRRIPELDGVRGLAAVTVVLYHAFPYSYFFWGWSSVDLFFVLSGYLITTIVLDQCDSRLFLPSFYVRRITRIWPVYYLTLAAVLAVNAGSSTGYPTTGLLDHLFFIQNYRQYFGAASPPFIHAFAPSWSVAVEEQFYLFWPVLILVLGRRSTPLLAAALLGISAICRLFLPGSIDLLGTRGDGLAFGCLLAWLLNHRSAVNRIWQTRAVFVAGAAGAIYVSVYLTAFWRNPYPQWTSFTFTGFALLFFAVIGSSVLWTGNRLLSPLRNAVLRWFGKISYAMYLFHLSLLAYTPAILDKLHVHSRGIQSLTTWVLIVGLPALSWYFLEGPLLRQSHQWLARTRKLAVAGAYS